MIGYKTWKYDAESGDEVQNSIAMAQSRTVVAGRTHPPVNQDFGCSISVGPLSRNVSVRDWRTVTPSDVDGAG